ncbi:hypothetical protein BTA51_11370 [Hahella sp. CCB-MM4]|uniref:macro domain-containing protein n=1 Tax=Hahella sp. (strain CCB-MM4) TaxID=1926491 RepID=UPI000B9A49A2|nr:macro domain-containing protein [Hahella sp. CCB-MM4]OZG73090.1 hypothetical protein BTA51_11370 [Hahella sp. CCB-MM4]
MIKFVSGDFFNFDADIMVNTVNCVGVMGAGVALAFKKRYPEMFADYVEKCKAKQIRPGRPATWVQKDMISKEIEIINFPTKDDWKKPSKYSYIEEGLQWLSLYLEDKQGKKVTLPALGCGHGGLEWSKVREMILSKLENSVAEIYVFEPSDSVKAAKHSDNKDEYESLLSPLGIGVMRSSNPDFPYSLSRYTKRDLYFFPDSNPVFEYDFALVCSTKPSEDEVDIITQFVELCSLHNRSILLGASAFEKKLSIKLSKARVGCGCFLPSGIQAAVKKMESKLEQEKPRLLSIGNPIKEFDKREFLPSVLGRIHLSQKTIFLTQRLSWVSKYKTLFEHGSIDSYYYNWKAMSDKDRDAAIKINAKELCSGQVLSDTFLREFL